MNRADVVSEVSEAFAGYEAALVANDRPKIVGYFWDSDRTVRFGICDQQTGAAELRRWRYAQPPLPPDRRLLDTQIVTFGADFAVVTTLFVYPGGTAVGRQSQAWVCLPEGWRIVSAHVSEAPFESAGTLSEAG